MAVSKGKGYSTEPNVAGSMMTAPRSWNLVVICSHWREAFFLNGFWGLSSGVGRTGMRIVNPVLLGSFSSLYGLIPIVWHFLSDKSSWSLFSCGREAYKMVLKNYIALYVLTMIFPQI